MTTEPADRETLASPSAIIKTSQLLGSSAMRVRGENHSTAAIGSLSLTSRKRETHIKEMKKIPLFEADRYLCSRLKGNTNFQKLRINDLRRPRLPVSALDASRVSSAHARVPDRHEARCCIPAGGTRLPTQKPRGNVSVRACVVREKRGV